MTGTPRIVGFVPYAARVRETQPCLDLLQTLNGDCRVSVVLCDGIFSDCDLHRLRPGGPTQRPANACLLCQADAANVMAKLPLRYRWLGRWLETADFSAAAAWVGRVSAADLARGAHGDWQLGLWVRESVRAHLGCDAIDPQDAQAAHIYRSYLNSAFLAATALTRLYDDAPAALIVAEGSLGVIRVAVEIAKARSMPVYAIASDTDLALARDAILARADITGAGT